MMILAIAASGSSFVAFPMVSSLAPAMALAFWMGLGLGLAGPMSQALLYDVAPPEQAGEVMGMRVTALNFCQAAVPLFSGAVSAALGILPVFWAMAAALLGMSYGYRRQWRRRD